MYKCLQFPKDISDVIPKEFETFHFTHAVMFWPSF